MQKLMLKLAIDYTHMGDWREHTYEQMYYEYYILGNYTTTFIRYSFFSTEKRIKRKKHLPSDCVGCKFFLIFILISERMKDKTGHRQPPNPQYLNKTKIITFYIYHHIDTQPFEFHLAARTPSTHLDHGATRSSSLLGCFSCFYRYWQMKRQVFQTYLHSFTIIYLLWFVNCVLTTWQTVHINL